MATFLTAPIHASKDGRIVHDDAKDQMNVHSSGNDTVTQLGKNDDGTYGLQVIVGGVAVGSTNVLTNKTQTIIITVTPPAGSSPVVSSWDDTFYKDAMTSGNEFEIFAQAADGYPGTAWDTLVKSQYTVSVFNSWGRTNNTNVKHVAMFQNRSASTVATLYVGQMRAIVVGSSAA